jgi:hypothetical protein
VDAGVKRTETREFVDILVFVGKIPSIRGRWCSSSVVVVVAVVVVIAALLGITILVRAGIASIETTFDERTQHDDKG